MSVTPCVGGLCPPGCGFVLLTPHLVFFDLAEPHHAKRTVASPAFVLGIDVFDLSQCRLAAQALVSHRVQVLALLLRGRSDQVALVGEMARVFMPVGFTCHRRNSLWEYVPVTGPHESAARVADSVARCVPWGFLFSQRVGVPWPPTP